jgi:D-alanyl-lipoteichoic acid acyltransferase DltB (MBOAT superfamily)
MIDYYAGIFIEKSEGKKEKKTYLALSVIANIGILFFFKYYNFFIDNVNMFFYALGNEQVLPYIEIILPVGLSFHTFQAMSYTIEVYNGNQKAEKHFGYYALYVMFYPQLVAGPIERPQNILHQFHQPKIFSYECLIRGLRIMLWGLFKKVVVADSFAIIVNQSYSDIQSQNGWELLLASYFFSFQIYCDFSGYTDIAIGSAKCMGYDLMKNFEAPYLSASISEFWSKWHISLSTWFRDYVYIPLGGNKVSKSKWIRNIIIVFLISGMWHGAKYTFLIWGIIHSIYIVIEIIIAPILSSIEKKINYKWVYKAFKVMIVFHAVTLAWIFFRANNTNNAIMILKKIFTSLFYNTSGVQSVLTNISFNTFIVIILSLLLVIIKKTVPIPLKHKYSYIYFIGLLMLIIVLGKTDHEQFIYFQF